MREIAEVTAKPRDLEEAVVTNLQKVRIDEEDETEELAALSEAAEALRLTAAAPPMSSRSRLKRSRPLSISSRRLPAISAVIGAGAAGGVAWSGTSPVSLTFGRAASYWRGLPYIPYSLDTE